MEALLFSDAELLAYSGGFLASWSVFALLRSDAEILAYSCGYLVSWNAFVLLRSDVQLLTYSGGYLASWTAFALLLYFAHTHGMQSFGDDWGQLLDFNAP